MAINRLIQGSLQSGLPKFDTVWDGRSAVGSMDPISAITLTSAQSSIQFNNIPQTYTHLQIRGVAISASTPRIYIRYNSDASANYTWHFLEGSGGTPVVTSGANQTENWLFINGFITANNPAPFITDILDYSNTSKFKTIRTLEGNDNNTSGGYIALSSGLWRSTSAISSINLFASTSTFSANSAFTLYGIR